MNYRRLVNKDKSIKEYEITGRSFMLVKAVDEEDILIDRTTWLNFLRLQGQLKKQGIEIGIDSAYRSLNRQENLYKKFVLEYGKEYSDIFVAPKGTSEHHTGLAIDLSIKKDGELSLGETEDMWQKIHENLSNFGFILRYPKGKEQVTKYPYEPWHIRYVGKSLAVLLIKQNLTLEEYYYKKEK